MRAACSFEVACSRLSRIFFRSWAIPEVSSPASSAMFFRKTGPECTGEILLKGVTPASRPGPSAAVGNGKPRLPTAADRDNWVRDQAKEGLQLPGQQFLPLLIAAIGAPALPR